MNIFFIKVKNFLFSKILYISILFLISVVIFFICFISTLNYNIVGACDSFFITAALLIGGGGLQIVGNQGTFDVMSYSFANLFASYKKGGEKKYEDVVSYRNLKQEKRNQSKFNFIFYFIYGVIYLIGAFICLSFIY